MSFSAAIRSIQGIMRKDVGVDGDAQRISQLVWLLFLKIFDAQEAEIEATVRDYRGPLPARLRWRNWAADPKGLTGDELIKFVDEDLFPSLKELRGTSPRHQLIRAAFADARNHMRSGTLLRQVINKLAAGVNFNVAGNRHRLGDIYEQILRDLRSAGNAGEFYTPRVVTEFMVERTNPRLGETALDPACGTGGFLTSALEHVRRQGLKTAADEQLLANSIHGVEKKPLPHLLCITNMLLHGVEVPANIRRGNLLASSNACGTAVGTVDVVLTNPPFGGFEEDSVDQNFPPAFRTQRTADLFLVRIVEILRDGGRCAIVLPDGLLFGEGVKMRIRRELLQRCNLHTIVRLPAGVFAPYTDIKTNLLFFTKGNPTTEIWYYEISCPPGLKRYTKTRPLESAELAPAHAWWDDRKPTGSAWRVSIDDVAARNYDLDSKNPHAGQNIGRDPAELLAEYRIAQTALDDAREQLFRELKTILTS